MLSDLLMTAQLLVMKLPFKPRQAPDRSEVGERNEGSSFTKINCLGVPVPTSGAAKASAWAFDTFELLCHPFPSGPSL